MGAMLWHHEVPWQPDVGEALRNLQASQFRRGYNFADELEKWRKDAETSLRLELESGDRFELAAIYSKQLELIAEVSASPAPETPAEQIEILRRVLPEEFGSVLDVTGINAVGGVFVMRVMTPAELLATFGTEHPTSRAAGESLNAVASQLDRGDSAAFAVFDDGDNPTGWVFVGYTVD